MERLFPIDNVDDIPRQLRQTPVGELLQYRFPADTEGEAHGLAGHARTQELERKDAPSL